MRLNARPCAKKPTKARATGSPALEKELADCQAEADQLRAHWEMEKGAIGRLRELKEEIEKTRLHIEQAEREYDLNRVAELRYGQLAQLGARPGGRRGPPARRLPGCSRKRLTRTMWAAVVSRWTGIPVAKLLEGEREKLLRLGDHLHQRLIGQDEAVQAVADAVDPCPLGAERPQPSDRLVSLPGSDRGRQNRTRTGTGRVSV